MKFTTPGIQKSFGIIKNRELPAKWHKLSKAKEITAAVTAVSFAAYSSFTDSVLGYFFLMELPATYNFTKSIDMGGWKVLSTVGAAYTFIGIFTSEGIATYKQARKLLGGIKPTYKNKASSIISPSLGFVLGTFNSINDSIATFGGMKYVFDITSTPALGTVLALSTINGVTDYSINGLWVIECLDDFIGSFTPAEGQSPAYTNKQVIAAFAMSLGAGSLLAYAWHSLSKAVVNETLSAVGINATYITDPLVEVLACGGATSNFVNGAGSIYPVLYKAAGAIGTVLTGIYNHMPSCCRAESDMVETDPLLSDRAVSDMVETDPLLEQTNEEFLQISGSEPEPYNDDVFVDALDHIPVELDGAESDADEPGNDAEFFDLPENQADVIDVDNLSEDERTTAAFLFNLFTPQRQIVAPATNTATPIIKK